MPSTHLPEQLDSNLFIAYYREIRVESKRRVSRESINRTDTSVPWRREGEKC